MDRPVPGSGPGLRGQERRPPGSRPATARRSPGAHRIDDEPLSPARGGAPGSAPAERGPSGNRPGAPANQPRSPSRSRYSAGRPAPELGQGIRQQRLRGRVVPPSKGHVPEVHEAHRDIPRIAERPRLVRDCSNQGARGRADRRAQTHRPRGPGCAARGRPSAGRRMPGPAPGSAPADPGRRAGPPGSSAINPAPRAPAPAPVPPHGRVQRGRRRQRRR